MSAGASAHRVVAIDGPAASGKSSVARALAKQIAFVYVNSGAMYRAVTWHVLQKGVPPGDGAAIAGLLEATGIDCVRDGQGSRILIDGIDPTAHLCDDRVNDEVSLVSSVPRLREILVEKMRDYSRGRDVVLEGRDIGSVVFPNADVKIYLDASPEERARRRAADPAHGISRAAAAADVAAEMAARDRSDRTRSTSPLTIPQDAVPFDTTGLSIEDTVEQVLAIVTRVMSAPR